MAASPRLFALPLIALGLSLAGCATTQNASASEAAADAARAAKHAADADSLEREADNVRNGVDSDMMNLTYPATEKGNVVENQFGVAVADPYRWLEDDVRVNPKVRQWVDTQSQFTKDYIAKLPGREAFKQELTSLYNYERFGLPRKSGGRYFYTRNDGLQNQSVLYVRDQLNGEGRVLIDPNTWSKDGATALAEWNPSKDGKKLTYAVQDGGTDWRIIRLLDVDTGKLLPDEIKWAKFGGGVEWAKDGSGFYYSRFPEPSAAGTFQSLNKDQKVYFHKLGTPQSADRLVYATPAHPDYGHGATLTDDGRYLVITSSVGTDDRYEVHVIDLQSKDQKPKLVFPGFTNNWSVIGNVGTKFYFVTNKDAPLLKIVSVDIAKANAQPVTVVPEDKATLNGASIIGGKLITEYLVDAKTEVRTYDLAGKALGTIPLPGMGSAGGFGGDQKDPETFFSFTSFTRPAAIYRYDTASGAVTPWAEPKLTFNPDDYTVEQRFYPSKDGTKIPMFIVAKKGAMKPGGAPTLLYAYGGFNAPSLPGYSATRMAWLEKGGVFALANIRGGGEYGKAWHDGGRLLNKQNVFDDFIAAGEYLKAQGITGKDQLAIEGRSNGGLLVGAVLNQRPDLFAAALPTVGVMDMLRFDKFTAGRYWVDDYGYPNKEADFKNLYAYSPYHNVKSGVDYPAIMTVTADTDDRVVPGHSFKYAAALQAANIGPKPHLIRIETRAGHGSGMPTEKVIEQFADMYAFIAYWTGLEVK